MDNYVILTVTDAESGELCLFDTGTKEQMTKLFQTMVAEGKESGDFYMMRVVLSAEVEGVDNLVVYDNGDEE